MSAGDEKRKRVERERLAGSVKGTSLSVPSSLTVADSALLAELQAKADLTETQPVSAATLPLPSGASTAALQETMQSLVETMQELAARIAVIAGWASSGAVGMRVVGVSMPSTAVTGPLTNAQVLAARPFVNIENTNAVLSNINNCTGA